MRKITWRRFFRAIYALAGTHFVAGMGFAVLMVGLSSFAPFSEWQPSYKSYEILHPCVLVFSIPLALWILLTEKNEAHEGILRKGIRLHKITWRRLRRAVCFIGIVQIFAIFVYAGILKLLSYTNVFGYTIYNIGFHACVLVITIPVSLWIIFIEPERA
jgi:hypothetical protein